MARKNKLTKKILVTKNHHPRQQCRGCLLIGLGLIGMSMWAGYWWRIGIAEAHDRQARLTAELEAVTRWDAPHPKRIFIQWFVDTSIEDGIVNQEGWTILPDKAVYVTKSARPGYPGNIIVYGHNTRQVLGNIRALKGYEKIKLVLSDGSERWYQVFRMEQVKPGEIKYLAPTSTEILTLFTCAGLADSDRFVVQALPIAK